jgi:inositol 3-alpha-galactosyltransferase
VTPFVPQFKRDILAAEGAYVKEINDLEIKWKHTYWSSTRWRDVYTKLNLWAETDFKKIAFLDSDAFPFENVDELFGELSAPSTCNETSILQEDVQYMPEICNYTMAVVPIIPWDPIKGINAGTIVLGPNKRMHERLVAAAPQVERYEGIMEQGLIEWQFAYNGSFPFRTLERKYNGFFPQHDESGKLKIVHEKLWEADRVVQQNAEWLKHWWDDIWVEMEAFYTGMEFRYSRESDNVAVDNSVSSVG